LQYEIPKNSLKHCTT